MLSIESQRRVRFWRPDSPSVLGMVRVDREERLKTTYAEHFSIVAVYEGAFDSWYRGRVHRHVAGAIKLKEPGEVQRDVLVHAPFTLQGATLSFDVVAAAASALGKRGPAHFTTPVRGAAEPATRLAFAMHAALVRPDVTELERATLVAETLNAILSVGDSVLGERRRAPRAVRLARAFLHEELADRITLDALAHHAQLDKFQLVRAFRSEVGLPPYEYLTHVRVSRAKELLQRGLLVAEAAQAVGFYDESQLHRHFRRIVGITPGRFSRSFGDAVKKAQHRPSRVRARDARSRHEHTQPH
jgi:AraC-like DNA-binding protein